MNIALLVLRLVAGGLVAAHGAQKLYGWFGGRGIDATGALFEKLGLRPGRTNAQLAGISELGAGVLIALGFLTPFAAILVISVMTTAIITVTFKNGPWVTNNGYEYNLVLMAVAFALAGVGAGKFSLDRAFNFDFGGAKWAFFALVAGVAGGYAAVAAGRREPADRSATSVGRPPLGSR